MNANHRRTARRARAQQGFTLIELSVAMLIGLFLLGGLLSITQDMRRTFTNQNQMSQMQDSERLAMTLITDVVQEAGYFPDPVAETISNAFPANPFYPLMQQGQPLWGVPNGAQGDQLYALFKTASNDAVINCRGGTNTTGGMVNYINEFYVDGAGNLNCLLTAIPGGQLPAVVLVTGVKSLQVLYGVQRSGAVPTLNADTYLTASQMSGGDWLNVICIKVTLTFDNSLLKKSQPGQPATIPFTRVITVMSNGGVDTE
jgi:type IV pilus assembly protein PilW